MEKEILIELVNKELSVREMIPYVKISYSTIRYWLNKYNLKTKKNYGKSKFNGKKQCLICKEIKEISNFYKSKNSIQTYCKICSCKYHQNRVKDVKIKMIEYKGGECEKCNLKLKNSHYAVFDFHHTNSLDKPLNFNRIKFQKWEKIKYEIDKCKLLCANCHRMEHAILNGWGNSERIVDIRNDKLVKYCKCGLQISILSKNCQKCYKEYLNEKKKIVL